jgi:hypothetical protein
MQCPLFGPRMMFTIEWQVDVFPNSDSSDASQQESIRIEVVCSAQFLLKPFIIFRRLRPRKILWTIVSGRMELPRQNGCVLFQFRLIMNTVLSSIRSCSPIWRR